MNFQNTSEYLDYIRSNSHLTGNRHYARISDNGYECSTKGDSRFSALKCRLKDGRTIEEAYQLDIKGYRIISNEWKAGKGKSPLSIRIATSNWTRKEAESTLDWLYIFTDNLNRTSGGNIGLYTTYEKIFRKGTAAPPLYPNKTQAVLRTLENAAPITTMKDQYKTQFTDLDLPQFTSNISIEISYIKALLRTGLYKGLIISNSQFGNGSISKMKDTAPLCWALLNKRLLELGINNSEPLSEILYSEGRNMYNEYLNLYQQWAMENPQLILDLAMRSHGKLITDMFAYTPVSQARALTDILNKLKI